jgi:hypothetical protein
MTGKRKAALARLKRIAKRAKVNQPVVAQAVVAQIDQARIDKWIRDRVVVDWRDSCWLCRNPIVVGQKFVDVRGDEATARFHEECEREWRLQWEALARRALGLTGQTSR